MIELYDNLMAVCNKTEASKFFYKDVTGRYGTKFRIFSYHYASYSDWLLDGALEARGIMFEMDDNGPVRIASRPMEKFFNLNENPLSMNLDLSKIQYVMDKADGSLISTYCEGDKVLVKSKTSTTSEQAFAAERLLYQDKYLPLYLKMEELAPKGYTFNLEYAAPNNRVVLYYEEPTIFLLNVRHNDTGEYVPYADLYADAVLRQYLIPSHVIDDGEAWVKETRKAEGIEGYIAVLESGQRFKLKTDWYCLLHHTKDSITSNERLYEAIVGGAADDLRAMFDGDTYAVSKIAAFESEYIQYLSSALLEVQGYYNAMRGRDRKDYAIKGQETATKNGKPELFNLMMQMYAGTMTSEAMVKGIEKAFLKVWPKYVPALYSKEIQMIEE